MLAFVQLNLMYFWSNLSILDILKRWFTEFVMRKFCSKSKQIYFVHPRGSISIEIKQSVVVGTILVSLSHSPASASAGANEASNWSERVACASGAN